MVVVIVAMPPVEPPWRQFRSLGSAVLALCDVAAGGLDGFLDCTHDLHAPWDYLGGLLVCRESGASVADARTASLPSSSARTPAADRGVDTGAARRAAGRARLVTLDLDVLLDAAVDAAASRGTISCATRCSADERTREASR